MIRQMQLTLVWSRVVLPEHDKLYLYKLPFFFAVFTKRWSVKAIVFLLESIRDVVKKSKNGYSTLLIKLTVYCSTKRGVVGQLVHMLFSIVWMFWPLIGTHLFYSHITSFYFLSGVSSALLVVWGTRLIKQHWKS